MMGEWKNGDILRHRTRGHRVVFIDGTVTGAPEYFYGEPLPPFASDHKALGHEHDIGGVTVRVTSAAFWANDWELDASPTVDG